MYPTPTVGCEEGGEQSSRVERTKSGSFYSEEEEQTRVDIWSETIGRNALSGEDVSHTEHEGLQGQRNYKEKDGKYYRQSNKTGTKYGVRLGRIDGVQRERCIRHQDSRLQRRDSEHCKEQKFGFSSNVIRNDEKKQTWWQIESDLCGVPNGISYELDKDRANRIKTLGNAIVPQIAREFGLAIKKV